MKDHPKKDSLHKIIYLSVLGALVYVAFSLVYYSKDSLLIWVTAALWALLF